MCRKGIKTSKGEIIYLAGKSNKMSEYYLNQLLNVYKSDGVEYAFSRSSWANLEATELKFYRAIRSSTYGFPVEPKGNKLKYDGFCLMLSLMDFTKAKELMEGFSHAEKVRL